MPKRPRQHQLEDESRHAFRGALPKQWVFRDSVPDYGIDGELEVFDDNGKATGLLFKVQLKATDERDLKRALVVRLERDIDWYYRSLELPTLIVRYHAPSKKLYVRWYHTFDLYYARSGKKTMSFRLSLDDEWSDETSSKLATELRLFRRLNSSELPLPIHFTVVAKHSTIHGVQSVKIISALRKAAEELHGVIAFTSESPKHAHPRIEMDSDKTLIDLAGLKTATYHTRNKFPTALALTKFPFDILLFVAVVLARASHNSIAAMIISQFADRSRIVEYPQVAIELTVCLARAQRITEALRLSEKVLDTKGAWFGSQILSFAPYMKKGPLSKGETDELIQLLDRRVEHSQKLGQPRVVATAHYNLGMMISARSPRRAIHHYRKAAEYDPGYTERQYFWRELAGILFGQKRYKLAAFFYKRAIEKGEENDSRVLYADALMFAGQYRDSQEAFQTYLSSQAATDDPWASEWRLKLLLLKDICAKLGMDSQRRKPSEAIKNIPKAVKHFSDDIRPTIKAALSFDALCWLAWADLARIYMSENNPADAFLSFLSVALNLRTDTESWCWSILTGLCTASGQAAVADIVTTAYLINGEAFVEGVGKFSENLPPEFPKDEFLTAVEEIVSKVSRTAPPTVLRILGKGADYKVIPLGNPELGALRPVGQGTADQLKTSPRKK